MARLHRGGTANRPVDAEVRGHAARARPDGGSRPHQEFHGRYLVRDGLVLSAITIAVLSSKDLTPGGELPQSLLGRLQIRLQLQHRVYTQRLQVGTPR